MGKISIHATVAALLQLRGQKRQIGSRPQQAGDLPHSNIRPRSGAPLERIELFHGFRHRDEREPYGFRHRDEREPYRFRHRDPSPSR